MRLGLLCVLLAWGGCGSCKKQNRPEISADPTIDGGDVDTKPAALESCFEPGAIVRREVAGGDSPGDGDPLTPMPSDHRDDRDTGPIAYFGSRAYEIAGNVVTAKDAGALVWSTPIADVSKVSPELRLSPAGHIVRVRRDPQFRSIVLDATSGHVLGETDDLTFAPNDAYAIEVPIKEDYDEGTKDVSLVLFSEPLVRRKVGQIPFKGADDIGYLAFGAMVCPTGATFAVSFATTELAVYRAKDGRKLASIPAPGNGMPVFSRSGRFIALQVHRSEDFTLAVFELVP